jgi:hypothetical protein
MLQLERALRRESALLVRGAIREAASQRIIVLVGAIREPTSQRREEFQQIDAQ